MHKYMMSSKYGKMFKKAARRVIKRYKSSKAVSMLVPKVNRLSRILNADRHWYDRAFAATPINSNPVLFGTLNSITTGDNNNQRQGNIVKAAFMDIKGTLALHPGNVIQVARVMLVRDWNAPQGTAPNPNQILDGTYFGTLNAPNAPRYVNKLKSYQVLYDKTFTLSVASNTTIRHFHIRKKLTGEIQFYGVNGTDWDKGSLYLIVLDDNATAVNDNSISFVSRLTYYP